MTRDEAIVLTGPYHGLLYSIIHDAWREWRQVQTFRADQSMRSVPYKRIIANYVHGAIANRAIPAFAAQEKVTVRMEAQTFKLLFGGLCARIKKGDENNLASNVPTFAALAFEEQDATLPGLPPETAKVDFIWRPNEIWTEIEHVLMVARDGDNVLWEYEIEAPAAAVDKSVFEFGTKTQSDASDEPLVKPKLTPQQQDELG